MAKYRAKSLVVQLTPDGGGSAETVSDEGTSFEVTKQSQEIDTTTFGDTSKTALPDDPNINATLQGFDTTGGAPALDYNIGDTGTIDWYPEGNTTGKRKYSAPYTVLSDNQSFAVAGIPTWQRQFKLNAEPTQTTVA